MYDTGQTSAPSFPFNGSSIQCDALNDENMIDEKKWKYQQKYALYVNSKDMTVTVAIIADFFLTYFLDNIFR